jgi:hypothetical protein
MLKTLKIVIGLSLGLVVVALLSNSKRPDGQDPSAGVEHAPSVQESGSPEPSAADSVASTPTASERASPQPSMTPAVAEVGSSVRATPVPGAAASRVVDLRGGVFGSVLSIVADWNEADLRASAEKTGETPRVLRQFSAEMAERMSEVWKDSATQEPAFAQLALCARTMSLASPVRALCASNAKRLALNDPAQFQERFKALEKTVAPEIREFLSQIKQVR